MVKNYRSSAFPQGMSLAVLEAGFITGFTADFVADHGAGQAVVTCPHGLVIRTISLSESVGDDLLFANLIFRIRF